MSCHSSLPRTVLPSATQKHRTLSSMVGCNSVVASKHRHFQQLLDKSSKKMTFMVCSENSAVGNALLRSVLDFLEDLFRDVRTRLLLVRESVSAWHDLKDHHLLPRVTPKRYRPSQRPDLGQAVDPRSRTRDPQPQRKSSLLTFSFSSSTLFHLSSWPSPPSPFLSPSSSRLPFPFPSSLLPLT